MIMGLNEQKKEAHFLESFFSIYQFYYVMYF